MSVPDDEIVVVVPSKIVR